MFLTKVAIGQTTEMERSLAASELRFDQAEHELSTGLSNLLALHYRLLPAHAATKV